MMSNARLPTAHAIGLPPKVEPCVPGPKVGADFIGGQNCANREAAAQGFGGAENIGCHTVMLVATVAAMPHAGLHFIQNQQKRRVCRTNGVRLADILG